MPILVTSAGPVSNVPAIVEPQVRTMADMINRIADELDDTNNEYLSQIQNAIFAAIRFCEREPLYFNESRDIVFATVTGRDSYDRRDNPHIGTQAGLIQVYCEDGSGQRHLLRRESPQQLELWSAPGTGRGRPRYYNYFAQHLRLWPVPDSDSYRIRMQLAAVRMQDIHAANEAHPWFYEAFDLIKARARYELYKDILRDMPMALTAFNDFTEQLSVLRAETSRRQGSGHIKATGF